MQNLKLHLCYALLLILSLTTSNSSLELNVFYTSEPLSANYFNHTESSEYRESYLSRADGDDLEQQKWLGLIVA